MLNFRGVHVVGNVALKCLFFQTHAETACFFITRCHDVIRFWELSSSTLWF